MAVAIALGARSMNDIGALAHQERVRAASSDTTARRTLELADTRPWTRSPGRGRGSGARLGAVRRDPGRVPWWHAGKQLAGWLVIDLDATLITARSDKEGRDV